MAQLDSLASAYPWTCQQFQPGCEDTQGAEQSILFEVASSIAGFVVYSTVLDEGSILNIAVLPSQQRQGIARRLLLAVQDIMRGKGVKRCLLEVRESNEKAIDLYASMGFVVDGLRKNYYRSSNGREGALLMSSFL